ncbi:helix-turn-helix transcriptional regulator [Pseudomonas brassicacearum]|uniref:Helix-turn-helix transcriptional regulator n=1 Tax=Pseudomonas brassicacearum TaxID=930166 RepID=A0AAJ3G3H9_9PSED|nr:helix-turn-helix transcriptional regulator [Pseudomonas brassicacearum]NUT84390.1 helix-turn-helix transcriptional regulator [Pseudomonas brassicacearum]
MNLQRLFPHVGKVIASTGSRHFPRMLHDLILTEIPVDATHITEQRIGTSNMSEPSTSSIGCVGMDNACVGALVDTHTAKPFFLADDILFEDAAPQKIPNFSRCLLKCERSDKVPGYSTTTQLHLTTRKNGHRYVLSIYRSPLSKGFTAQEHALLKDFSCLLLPMVEEHVAALVPPESTRQAPFLSLDASENDGMEALRQRFADRLLLSGLSLSSRETEVCVGLLAGRTAPELAEQLNLKVNTVESYLKRAAIKMGIGGRRSLIRWMHSMDAAPAHMEWNGSNPIQQAV